MKVIGGSKLPLTSQCARRYRISVSMTSNGESDMGSNNGNDTNDQLSREPHAANPWKTFAGIWSQNPDFDVFCNEIKQVREQVDRVDAGS